MKPGIRTTEFWLTCIKSLIGPTLALLVALDLLPKTADPDTIEAAVEKAVGGILAVVGMFVSGAAVSSYTNGRTAVKINENTAEEAQNAVAEAIGFSSGGEEEEPEDEHQMLRRRNAKG